MTGMADERFLTITPLSRIGMSSVTRGSITAISATAADSMGPRVFTGARAFTEVPAFTLSQEHAPARSVALITAAMFEASLLAGGRVLEVVSMEAVSMGVVADVIGSRTFSR
jgi:hypothetical protein